MKDLLPTASIDMSWRHRSTSSDKKMDHLMNKKNRFMSKYKVQCISGCLLLFLYRLHGLRVWVLIYAACQHWDGTCFLLSFFIMFFLQLPIRDNFLFFRDRHGSYGSWFYNYLYTIYAISAYHHWCCEFESWSERGVQHYVINVYQWLATGRWFPSGPLVSSTN